MSKLVKRIEKLEQRLFPGHDQMDVCIAEEKARRAEQLSVATPGGFEAMCQGRWDDLSAEAQQAWREYHEYSRHTDAEIELIHTRMRENLPKVLAALKNLYGEEQQHAPPDYHIPQ